MRSGNFEIIHRVQLLQDALGKAIIISKEATHRIEELQVQLSIVQRQCTTRDRPLCDTLRLRGFDDNGILNTLTKVRLVTACTCIQLTIASSLRRMPVVNRAGLMGILIVFMCHRRYNTCYSSN